MSSGDRKSSVADSWQPCTRTISGYDDPERRRLDSNLEWRWKGGDAPQVWKVRPKFHLARLDSTRSTLSSESRRASRDERVERVEPCCSKMADDEQAIVLACTSLVVFMLLHTQILFVSSNEINYINVYSNKLVNNLHIIPLHKLHNKLSCVSS